MALKSGRVGILSSLVDLAGNIKISKILPYMRNSSFQEVIVSSDGSVYSIEKASIDGFTISSANLSAPEGYHIIDYWFEWCAIKAGKVLAKNIIRTSSIDREYVTLPTVGDCTGVKIIFLISKNKIPHGTTPSLLSDDVAVVTANKVAQAKVVATPSEETIIDIEQPIEEG